MLIIRKWKSTKTFVTQTLSFNGPIKANHSEKISLLVKPSLNHSKMDYMMSTGSNPIEKGLDLQTISFKFESP